MNTVVRYTPPTEDSDDDSVFNEIEKGSKFFGKKFSNCVLISPNGAELSFYLQPIDQSKTWSSLGLRAFGAVCGTIKNVTSFVYELLPTVTGTVTGKEVVLVMSFNSK